MIFGNLEIDALNVQAVLAVFISTLLALIFFLKFSGSRLAENSYLDQPAHLSVSSGEEMIDLLKENSLWELSEDGGVSPLVFASYPENINEFEISDKKRVFFHGLLPAALVALKEVEEEKIALHAILAKFPGSGQNLTFTDDYALWGRLLTMDEIEFVLMLTRKYRTNRTSLLLRRVDLVPLSMIMAQAAIESSWGTSRFAREGNNLFGLWTWGEKGLVPEDRDEGQNHKVAMYDSILDSVKAYVLTLNRLPAYRTFREIRMETRNPMEMVDGLLYYSQRRGKYVWEVKNLIKYNELRQYDGCFLAERPVVLPPVRPLRVTRVLDRSDA